MLRILFLEPFGGGSHQTLYQGWQKYSKHQIEILELPAVHWKWRSRHASLTLAEWAEQRLASGAEFDVVVASSMLNLPEWLGLADPSFRAKPTVVYFHENQLTYPLSPGQVRDYHFGYSNILSVLAADQCWFNSEFHLRDFTGAACKWLRRMPDYRHLDEFESAMQRARVLPPGIDPPDCTRPDGARPGKARPGNRQSDNERSAPQLETDRPEDQLTSRLPAKRPVIGWVSRWEHDKQPELFVRVVGQLLDEFDFDLVLLGQTFNERPDCLAELVDKAGDRILHCGFAASREEYWSWLSRIDLVVSTAVHEFFGLGIVEAMHAGARPLLPDRLAYPEVLRLCDSRAASTFLYEGDHKLQDHLRKFFSTTEANMLAFGSVEQATDQFLWSNLAPQYDTAVERLIDDFR